MGSISMPQGRGNRQHNLRNYGEGKLPSNIDAARTEQNIVWRDESTVHAYHRIFDDAVTEYNTKQKAKEIENDIINNKNEKKEINEKLNLTLENLKNIHKNKNYVIQKLYNHYLNLLHEGKDTRNEGLSWIIREIFNLDKKVMLSYMPEFLDKLCIQYLFNMTHLNVEISEVEKEIKVERITIQKDI